MEAINTLNPADRELLRTGLFGSELSTEASTPNQNQLLDYIVGAALVLADKMIEQKKTYQTRFLVSSGQYIRSIAIEQVAYFVSDGRYSKLVTHSKERYLLDQSLESLMQKVDPTMFYRVNRQTIVSYQAIQKIAIWSKSRVKLELYPITEKDVIVSVDNSGGFKKWLNR